MLMIVTVLPAAGAVNVQNVLPVASGLIGIKIVATVTMVTDSNNLLGGAIHVNDTITGKYIYNSGAPDIEPDPNIGAYLSTTSPCGIELKAGDFVFKTDPSDIDLGIAIWNDYVIDEYPPTDEFVLCSLNIYHSQMEC